MVGRADCNQRLARVEICLKVPQLLVRQRQQPAEQDQQIGLFQVFQPRNVVRHLLVFPPDLLGRIDVVVGIEAEEHRAMKAVVLRQQPGQHRHHVLAAVFLVGGDQDNMPAFARARLRRVGQPEVTLGNGMFARPPTRRKHRGQYHRCRQSGHRPLEAAPAERNCLGVARHENTVLGLVKHRGIELPLDRGEGGRPECR
jgi:hypothetical protein